MTTVFLVRHALHGQVGKALVGRAPGVPLSPEGAAQAEGLRRHFSGIAFTRVLSSPIQRAIETADAIAGPHHLPVEVADDLVEIDCGEWTGLSFADLDRDPRWHEWNSERHRAVIPGGETFGAVKARVSAMLDGLAAAGGGPFVLVSHSDVIKAAVAVLIDMAVNLHHRIVIDPASITTVELWGPGEGRILRMNELAPP